MNIKDSIQILKSVAMCNDLKLCMTDHKNLQDAILLIENFVKENENKIENTPRQNSIDYEILNNNH